MRKIAVFGVVFVVIALAVCLASCSSPSAVIYFSVNGEIVRSQVVTETSGLDDFTPSLADGTFLGWFTDEACTIPFSFHDYILAGMFEDLRTSPYTLSSRMTTPDRVIPIQKRNPLANMTCSTLPPNPPPVPNEAISSAGIALFASNISQTKLARHT